MSSLLSRAEVKQMLLDDLARKTKGEFFHDGMKCLTCGYPVSAGAPLYIIGGKKCCQDCMDAIVKTIKEFL